ncbi:hypothetical protein J3L16_13725 [Alteromonas sp. 5E99-2]|uniref:chorismate transformation enzyme, FkbO/Hyg5 family n=1 Tax=Alteromonas sp. 5E99-2 TaxID=2817683 RepID=UPI001A982B8A|nr:hypothetical protein [Alteromonas sp. 5E99-2]MBO1256747.1 hypothetical protein [Alteromonas sp. 5E99-2]
MDIKQSTRYYNMLNHNFSPLSSDELLNTPYTLAVMPFSSHCAPSTLGLIYSGLEQANLPQVNELWTVEQEVTRGVSGRNHWSKNESIICVAYWLTEDECNDIENSTYQAYTSVLSEIKSQGFPHAFRFWNYLPSINNGSGDAEIYKKFCSGRLRAFEQLNIESTDFPAASALGHHGKGAVVYVFASSQIPLHFNNNKQVNAFEYPRQYGISSPSFARATHINLGSSSHLFISGTASIIGHKTVEQDNISGQLDVTAANIEHLLVHANPDKKALSTFKIYVRHQDHVEFVSTWIKQHYPEVKSVITLADICRSDLLVEIECVCQ